MPLEATMMILDNSEYMRNGDYPSTRFDAMADSAHIIFTTKTDSNPENSVGVMTASGKGGPEVLVTHTREVGKIIQGAHDARKKIGGSVDIPTAINVAQLALKHRQNKNLRQRIILFLGSPPDGPGVDDKNLTKLAKKLKKNNIALDVIAFGDGMEEMETPLMKLLVDNTNSGENSHYISVPPDPRRLLSDVILSSPILAADRGDRDAAMADITNTAGAGEGGGFEEYGGVDPTLDPELAMVMRMSMEEERARQRALQQAAGQQQQQQVGAPAESSGAGASTSTPAVGPSTATPQPASTPASAPAVAAPSAMSAGDDDEEAALQEALRLSQQQEDVEMADTSLVAGRPAAGGATEEEEDEEAAIARAIEMSMMPDSDQQQQQQGEK
ncbi:hypothetical protein A7U60_g4542 [Sanghuangporus baumii]|uniref:VWFA domain-containing protein n=1 Tax=Sanghuangporus baumii TaxID=108892 RepID=A0A9Q5HYS3_SANBA|nr:hypothetical protein A7U60_g4542 [Sanghuangporus baumii]